MPTRERYTCLRCAKHFEIEVLSPEESRKLRDQGKPVYRIVCPDCKTADVKPGTI
jgi:transposase-like protein